jgi:hypothetical protein
LGINNVIPSSSDGGWLGGVKRSNWGKIRSVKNNFLHGGRVLGLAEEDSFSFASINTEERPS